MTASCEHHHLGTRPSEAAIAETLTLVEGRFVSDGERMTAPRRRVLELLLTAAEPVKAYDLIARYGTDGQAAKPPTVYRALEFLERQGVVHRIASISAYVACTADSGPDALTHAAAFLICDCCGATAEVPVVNLDAVSQAAIKAGYSVERTTIEGHGRCAACQHAA